MDIQLIFKIIKAAQPFIIPILPTIILVFGGQLLLDNYAVKKKRRETEIDLISSIRKEQYETLSQLYSLFARFMELYRIINSDFTDLSNAQEKKSLYALIANAESQVDSLILKIGCEFTNEDDDEVEVEAMLGNLRQSIQLWRERVSNGEKLPFNISSQEDYLRFKTAFSYVSAFMINKIHNRFEAPKVKMKLVEKILIGSFDNRHEKWNLGSSMIKSENKKYYDPKLDIPR